MQHSFNDREAQGTFGEDSPAEHRGCFPGLWEAMQLHVCQQSQSLGHHQVAASPASSAHTRDAGAGHVAPSEITGATASSAKPPGRRVAPTAQAAPPTKGTASSIGAPTIRAASSAGTPKATAVGAGAKGPSASVRAPK